MRRFSLHLALMLHGKPAKTRARPSDLPNGRGASDLPDLRSSARFRPPAVDAVLCRRKAPTSLGGSQTSYAALPKAVLTRLWRRFGERNCAPSNTGRTLSRKSIVLVQRLSVICGLAYTAAAQPTSTLIIPADTAGDFSNAQGFLTADESYQLCYNKKNFAQTESTVILIEKIAYRLDEA